ncbi:hypothetical protein XNC3_250024 [Xenorhabdus nematophila F1]|nr:hypothetical protein XNC3_250024 [Xenorhabdus nematophila F1]CEF30820.1 hypothetical protein XNW1_2850047 [Xenorhabdus nematophila str. Websteri]
MMTLRKLETKLV